MATSPPQPPPQGILSTSANNPTASTSTGGELTRKARLVGPEIVQLPDPVDAESSDDETDAEDDGATELGGEPRTRNKDSLRDVPDDTEDLDLTHSSLDDALLLQLQIPRFKQLKRLGLRQNQLTCLPAEVFGGLAELEDLDLYDNRLTTLDGLGPLTGLTSLDFSFNNLRSLLLPPSHAAAATPPLEALAKLEQVYLIQNKISRIEGLTGPGLAQNLRSLELGGNRIREIQGLDNLAALEELWLGKNKIRTLENLSSLKKLKILSIQSNRITVLAGLEELESLEELYISHNGIAKIEGLAQNKRLRVLDVGNNRIEKIEGLEGLDELEEFWASGNQIPDLRSLAHLEKKTKLETVYLEGNPCETNDRGGYRRKVILGLPQLKQVDATFVR